MCKKQSERLLVVGDGWLLMLSCGADRAAGEMGEGEEDR